MSSIRDLIEEYDALAGFKETLSQMEDVHLVEVLAAIYNELDNRGLEVYIEKRDEGDGEE